LPRNGKRLLLCSSRQMLVQTPPSKVRTLLVLGRVSNLPTVWSNCLAGWWLGGGGRWALLAWTCLGTSLLYVAGMFLNDAFDVHFDRQHRPSRPIPSGAVTLGEVWFWGATLMVAGLASLCWMGPATAQLALALAVAILVYDAFHKLISLAPLIMGLCRCLVYVVAASVAVKGVTGLAVWSGCALALYIVGLSYLARKEALWAPVNAWSAVFLAAPIALALLADDTEIRNRALLLSAMLALWIVASLRLTFGRAQPQVGKTVAKLLAGIVLVDLLAAADLSQPWIFLFPVWFVLALLLQKLAPAT
jgi:4-hydroxybenzoate polyprenyltransferase